MPFFTRAAVYVFVFLARSLASFLSLLIDADRRGVESCHWVATPQWLRILSDISRFVVSLRAWLPVRSRAGRPVSQSNIQGGRRAVSQPVRHPTQAEFDRRGFDASIGS